VIDANVTKVENDTQKSLEKRVQFPLRPGYSSRGTGVVLYTNYFKLDTDPKLVLERYSIDVKGARPPAGKKLRRVIDILTQQIKEDIATDFNANLVSRTKLEQEAYEVQYFAEDDDGPGENSDTYKIKLTHNGTLTVEELVNYLTSSQAGAILNQKEQIIQALNIVIGHYPKAAANTTSIGANKHANKDAGPGERTNLGGGLEAIRGFFVSVRAATARILLNVQVKNLAFYQAGPLEALMFAYGLGSKLRLANFLKKVSVAVTHIKQKNASGQIKMRIKSIQGLAHRDDGHRLDHPPDIPQFGAGPKQVRFWLSATQPSGAPVGQEPSKKAKKASKSGPPTAGRYITVFDFFKETYNITLKKPDLPVLRFGTRENPTYLPAEVCEVVPGQAASSKLSESQTQAMVAFAVRKPHLNAQSIDTQGRQLLGCDPANSVQVGTLFHTKHRSLTFTATIRCQCPCKDDHRRRPLSPEPRH
jgi:eukaryotic translation initiation factor 2C